MSDNHEVLAPAKQGTTLPVGQGTLADALPAIKQKMETMEAIQAFIDRKVDPETDFDAFTEYDKSAKKDVTIVRRNHSYAKKVFGVVGRSFEWLKDPQGRPLVEKHIYKDDEGEYYVYEAYGRYTLPGGQTFEGSGMFSSRDKFFGTVAGEFKPVSEVNERSIRQAAQTECFKKCIFTALGYGEASEADMQKKGVDTAKTGKQTFGKGTQGGNTDDGEAKDKRDEIKTMCIDLQFRGVKDEDDNEIQSPEEVLTYLTKSAKEGGFTGWRSFEKISARGLEPSYKQVKACYESMSKAKE